SRQLVLPEDTDQAGKIEAAALELADRLLRASDGLFADGAGVRLIGVGVSKLTEKKEQVHQMDLFEWADRQEEEEAQRREQEAAHRAEEEAERRRAEAAARKKEKQDRLDAMLRQVNSRYGSGTLERGAGKNKEKDTGENTG
ncbi:MAG: hypothetical protein IKG66_05795, partial [Lachnospiraceae bacterium]|nr:hypothetical protein [Lachnospiraceae bacterium]